MRHLALILVFAFAACAQVTDGIITTVTRTVNIAPDEADFVVAAATTLDTTLQQLTQVFHDAGIQNLQVANVAAGVNGNSYPPVVDSQLFYQISFTTAPAAMKDFAKKLDTLRGSLPSGITAMQYAAALNASQSAVDAAHQAALPQLLQDARSKAQALATAAGLKVGAITGVTESNYGAVGVLANQWFNVGIAIGSFISSGNNTAGTQYTFHASVKFAAQ